MGTLARSTCVLCSSQLPFHRLKCCRCSWAFGSFVDAAGPVTHSETLPKTKGAFEALSWSRLARETTAPWQPSCIKPVDIFEVSMIAMKLHEVM